MKPFSRLLAITQKEVRQMRRDRLTFAMIFGMPLMQLLMFGYAINMDVRNLKTAIADEANTSLSREFVLQLSQTQVTDIVEYVDTVKQLEQRMREGEISVGVAIPSDFDRRIVDNRRAAAHILVDGSDPTTSGIVEALRDMPIRLDTSPDIELPYLIEVRNYYNPEGRTPVNIIPGLIGVILTMTMMLFTAQAIVRERERGNLELLINTPVTSAELMVGKVIPYIVIGMVQLALTVWMGQLLFDVPVRGSLIDLYLAASLFITANLALGLFVSTAVKTQFQAMQLTFFLILPSILLSGFVFPFDGMPTFAQWIGEALPITHFIRLTRGIMLREAELGDMPIALIYLGVFTLVAMTAAALRFSKRLD
ncbi:MAG: ABC transporter permease [Pseudomonadota bacterium]